MQDFILTIGCEYGSGGPDIAKMIAKDLGYPCYDRPIIDRIIEETGLSKEMAEKLEAGVEIRGRSQALQNTASPSKYSILTDRVVYLQTQIIRLIGQVIAFKAFAQGQPLPGHPQPFQMAAKAFHPAAVRAKFQVASHG